MIAEILNSLTRHFQSEVVGNKFFTGEKRETDKYNEWVEVRFRGPDVTYLAGGKKEYYVTVNALVSGKVSTTDIYKQNKLVASTANAFPESIMIYNDTDEVGCMNIDTDVVPHVKITHYGEDKVGTDLLRSSIEANYKIEV